MSILKTVLIFALVVAVASARQRGRQLHRQRGREMEEAVADAADTPEAVESNAVIGEAVSEALENHEVVANPEDTSALELAISGSELVDNLIEASEAAVDQPQAQEIQAEIVQEQVDDNHDELEKALNLAKKHQKKLAKYGDTMTPDEVILHQAKLQKYLALALHYAQQHDVAVQQDKAIEEGAAPAEAVDVAEEVKLEGRSLKTGGRSYN